MPDDKRKVCPGCHSDERLFSVEKMEVMYPIRATGNGRGVEIDYTGAESIYLDDTATYDGTLYCRECDRELSEDELVDEPSEDE